jgi:hypothetical protein
MNPTEILTVSKGRPPAFNSLIPNAPVFCGGSKLFLKPSACGTAVIVLSYTSREGSVYKNMQEVTRVNLDRDWVPGKETNPSEEDDEYTDNLDGPWTCPWPYYISSCVFSSSEKESNSVRIDCENEPGFWCGITASHLPMPKPV